MTDFLVNLSSTAELALNVSQQLETPSLNRDVQDAEQLAGLLKDTHAILRDLHEDLKQGEVDRVLRGQDLLKDCIDLLEQAIKDSKDMQAWLGDKNSVLGKVKRWEAIFNQADEVVFRCANIRTKLSDGFTPINVYLQQLTVAQSIQDAVDALLGELSRIEMKRFKYGTLSKRPEFQQVLRDLKKWYDLGARAMPEATARALRQLLGGMPTVAGMQEMERERQRLEGTNASGAADMQLIIDAVKALNWVTAASNPSTPQPQDRATRSQSAYPSPEDDGRTIHVGRQASMFDEKAKKAAAEREAFERATALFQAQAAANAQAAAARQAEAAKIAAAKAAAEKAAAERAALEKAAAEAEARAARLAAQANMEARREEMMEAARLAAEAAAAELAAARKREMDEALRAAKEASAAAALLEAKAAAAREVFTRPGVDWTVEGGKEARQKAEDERAAAEAAARAAREMAERLEAEARRLAGEDAARKLEAERKAGEQALKDQEARERLERERLEREAAEKEAARLAAERAERERLEAEENARKAREAAELAAAEAARLAAEEAARKAEAERKAAERAEQLRLEEERLAREKAEREAVEYEASKLAEEQAARERELMESNARAAREAAEAAAAEAARLAEEEAARKAEADKRNAERAAQDAAERANREAAEEAWRNRPITDLMTLHEILKDPKGRLKLDLNGQFITGFLPAGEHLVFSKKGIEMFNGTVQLPEGVWVDIKGSGVSFHDLTLVGQAPAQCRGLVQVYDELFSIDRCRIGLHPVEGSECSVIYIGNTTAARVLASEIKGGSAHGIHVHGPNAQAHVEMVTSSDNRRAGFCVEGKGAVLTTGKGCVARDNEHGYFAFGGGDMQIGPGCESFENTDSGYVSIGKGSTMTCGRGCIAERNQHGFFAFVGGKVTVGDACIARNNVDCGFYSVGNEGHLNAGQVKTKLVAGRDCISEGNEHGFVAIWGKLKTAENCVSRKNRCNGFVARCGKLKPGPGTVAENNEGIGFMALVEGRLIIAPGCEARGNALAQYEKDGPGAKIVHEGVGLKEKLKFTMNKSKKDKKKKEKEQEM